MAWSTPDLSSISQALHDMLQDAVAHSSLPHFNVNLSLASPETARKSGGCQLSLYLLHVGRDVTWRNTPVQGPRPQPNSAQPLSLNLFYLLTAWADADFSSEQQAMSIALQCFHSRPIYKHSNPDEEFTISIEADTIDEMSRLWQAFAAPIRLSALIKVGVVFIAPLTPPAALQPPPVAAALAVAPTLTGADGPQLVAVSAGLNFLPQPPPPTPDQVTVASRAVALAGGATALVAGSGLNMPAATDVFLSAPASGTEWRVTAQWRQGQLLASEFALALPAAYMDPSSHSPPPPAATPSPGVYLLTVGNQATGQRSNAVPLVIAARVDNVANPPLLGADGAGVYHVAGAGFVPGATTIALDTLVLVAAAASPPSAGQYFVDPAGGAFSFMLPSPKPPAGRYPLRIRVNSVETPPNWVVEV